MGYTTSRAVQRCTSGFGRTIKGNFTLFTSNKAIPIPNLRITEQRGDAGLNLFPTRLGLVLLKSGGRPSARRAMRTSVTVLGEFEFSGPIQYPGTP
jgi:hypothetical protein